MQQSSARTRRRTGAVAASCPATQVRLRRVLVLLSFLLDGPVHSQRSLLLPMKWFCGAAQIYLNELPAAAARRRVVRGAATRAAVSRSAPASLRKLGWQRETQPLSAPLSRTLVTYQNPTGNSELSLCGDQTLSQWERDECQGEYPDLADRRVDKKYS